jgi:hypothetical protein
VSPAGNLAHHLSLKIASERDSIKSFDSISINYIRQDLQDKHDINFIAFTASGPALQREERQKAYLIRRLGCGVRHITYLFPLQ